MHHTCLSSFGNSVAYFVIKTEKDKYVISCNLYHFDSVDYHIKLWRRIEDLSLSHGFRKSCNISINHCASVLIAETGLQFPFVILNRQYVSFNKKVREILHIGVLPHKSCLEDDLKMITYGDPVELPERCTEPLYLSGPSVCFIKDDELNLHHLLLGETNKKFRHRLKTQMRLVAGLTTFKMGDKEHLTGIFICLLLSIDGSARVLKTSLNIQTNTIVIEQVVDWKQGLLFTSHLKIATVCQFLSFDINSFSIFTCTRQSQLLRADCWTQPTVIKTLKLPFADAKYIYPFTSANVEHGIIMSQSGAALIVNLKTFEIVKSVTEPFLYAVGNFAPLLRTQLLMIKNTEPNIQLPDRYYELTDFKEVITSSDKFKSKNSEATSFDDTLYNKLIAAETSVSIAESSLNHLSKTHEEISSILRCLSVGEEPITEQYESPPHTFELITRSGDKPQKSLIKSEVCTPIQFSLPWKILLENNWIVGVDITNSSQSLIWDVQLVASTSLKDLCYSGKFFNSSERCPSSPVLQASKRQKFNLEDDPDLINILKPDQNAILTVVLETAVVEHHSNIQLDLEITFKKKDTHGKIITVCVNCNSCIISVEHLLNNTSCTFDDDVSHDLAALDAITEPVNLSVISSVTDLIELMSTCKQNTLLQQHTYLQILYWPKSKNSQLDGVWIEFLDAENSQQAHLCVHTRSRHQTFLLLHYLYQNLPEDIVFVPHKQYKPSNLLESMKAELNLMSSIHTKVMFAFPQGSQTNLLMYRKFRKRLNELEKETDDAYTYFSNGSVY